jgi:hypothetical protein
MMVGDELRSREPFCRPGARFCSFHCAIAWRRIGNETIEQVLGGMCHVIDSTVESSFVYFRRLCETAQFADKLQ